MSIEAYPKSRVVANSVRIAARVGYVEAERPFLEFAPRRCARSGRPLRPLWVVCCWGLSGQRPSLGVAFYDRAEALSWARTVWPAIRSGCPGRRGT